MPEQIEHQKSEGMFACQSHRRGTIGSPEHLMIRTCQNLSQCLADGGIVVYHIAPPSRWHEGR